MLHTGGALGERQLSEVQTGGCRTRNSIAASAPQPDEDAATLGIAATFTEVARAVHETIEGHQYAKTAPKRPFAVDA
jgi:hypothetical protein